jgi:hypothetical protein
MTSDMTKRDRIRYLLQMAFSGTALHDLTLADEWALGFRPWDLEREWRGSRSEAIDALADLLSGPEGLK